MSDLTKIATVVKVAVKTGKVLAKDKDVVKLVCGKYSDGSVRNLTDAIQGEYLSPKQKKKKKKKSGKKKKKNKINNSEFRL